MVSHGIGYNIRSRWNRSRWSLAVDVMIALHVPGLITCCCSPKASRLRRMHDAVSLHVSSRPQAPHERAAIAAEAGECR
jgi:hypothetical protein